MAPSLHQKPPKPTTISTTMQSSPCTIVFIVFLCFIGIYALHHLHPKPLPSNTVHFEQIFINSSNNFTISTYLHSLTLHPHVAGTQLALQTAQYVLTQLTESGLETHTTDYEALLSYPAHSSLAVHFRNGTSKYLYLNEVGLSQTGGVDEIVAPYHAYSPSGSAIAMAVFVNYGREEDYRALGALGVNVSGCVAIARNGDVPRGRVVQMAAERGALAVLLYADRNRFRGSDEGFFPDGIERGTVMRWLGDPLTPGWAGINGGERMSTEDGEVAERFPKIPSMPISAKNAEMILGTLGGPLVPYEWRDTLHNKGCRVGSGPTWLNFSYQEEERTATIRNVFAVIRGREEPDRYVLLGNHRDAWTYGAVDPNSGTAALLDIARRYGHLLRLGWTPRRTIILCSWDAEEFGMIGSTEWVEQNLLNLCSQAVAYLNVDCAVQGPGFFAGSTPQLDNLLVEVTKKIKDPDSVDMTVYQTWFTTNGGINIQRLNGADSDFAAFLQHAGVPSVDMYYGKDFPVYHTAFDSYDWMMRYGDPLFHRHVAIAEIWGLLAFRLADEPLLPFNYRSYAAQLQEHVKALDSLLDGDASLHHINTSIQELAAAANAAEEEAKNLKDRKTSEELSELWLRSFNDRLMRAERGFLDAEGLKGRQWFKHLVYGPSNDYESKLISFPGIADAISRATKMTKTEGQLAIQHELWRVARAIQRAAIALKGELT